MNPTVNINISGFGAVQLDALGGIIPPVGATIRYAGHDLRVTAVHIDYTGLPYSLWAAIDVAPL